MKSFEIGRAPSICFGEGTIDQVPNLVARLGVGQGPVLLVADHALLSLGLVGDLERSLSSAGLNVEIAADIAGEPKMTLVDLLIARAAATGCQAVIALGGGAAMDAAKLVAATVFGQSPVSNYALGAEPLPAESLPSIAVPTTAGTGSEVTRTAVISAEDGRKLWFWGEQLLFDQAVLDPVLTLSLPAEVTAWTGIDAVSHALEGTTAQRSSPAGDLYGYAALRLLSRALPAAVALGSDLSARGQVLWAATLAGRALDLCGTHLGHNISHALGSLAPVHHGLATGLGLEAALPLLVSRPDGREAYAQACAALGGPAEAEALPDVFIDLLRTVGIPAGVPASCAGLSAGSLSAEMKSSANRLMAENAACEISDADLEWLATHFLQRHPRAA